MTTDFDHTAYIAALREDVSRELAALAPDGTPLVHYDSIGYVLEGGGKRLRPVLTLLAAEIFGVEVNKAMPAALAMEIFHSFTLVIDDVMDHADSRRGRPAVHMVWDSDTAILCSFHLLSLSYDLLAGVDAKCTHRLTQLCSNAVVRVCEGQAFDKAFEKRSDVTVEEYMDMIDRKTGALIERSLEAGGIIAHASCEQLQVLTRVGREVGRAFQIQDDLLDLVAGDSRWGKRIGGDLVEGKKTLLVLEALRLSTGKEKAWFARIFENSGLPADEIDEARSRMDRLGVLDNVRAAVVYHSEKAVDALQELPANHARDTLKKIIRQMQERVH